MFFCAGQKWMTPDGTLVCINSITATMIDGDLIVRLDCDLGNDTKYFYLPEHTEETKLWKKYKPKK